MALTQSERIQISEELVDLPQKIISAQSSKTQIESVRDDLQDQDDSIKLFFDDFNSTIDSYQNELRWINGDTSTSIIEANLIDAAKRTSGNLFFPITPTPWINFPPKADPAVIGSPISESTDDEDEEISTVNSNFDLLVNGQVSVVVDDNFNAATSYSGGTATLLFQSGGQTIGNLLVLEDGIDGSLVRVTNVVGLNITVDQIIAPIGVLSGVTVNVIENIAGFTNSERNTLTATAPGYQNILDGLNTITQSSVSDWETSLNNQKTELQGNIEDRATQVLEIASAISDINSALVVIDAWQALPDTGSTGSDSKYTNNNITTLQAEATARLSYTAIRLSEISTALGTVSQSGIDGSFSGSGMYLNRFNTINLRINLIGGVLSEFFEKEVAITALDQLIFVSTSKQTLFETELTLSALGQNATGNNTIQVLDATGFSISDTIFVMANDELELTGTILNIEGNIVTLSFSVPNTYTTIKRARLYKQI